jgi:release factor glutamine methyltransferase
LRIKDLMAKAGDIQGLDVINIISFALSMRKEGVLAGLDAELDEEKSARIDRLLNERRRGKPLAYITGEKEFFSHPFLVDERVLIPRPETELLVEEALSILEKSPPIRSIVDMGTGSGIIGATIARLSSRDVLCTDVSVGALNVAKENARRAGVEDRLTFLCSDLFDGVRKEEKFDMILANLPYVREDEWAGVMVDVKDFEPTRALLGGPDGLDIYRRLIQALPERLGPEGYVLLEIGAPGQAEKVGELFKSCGIAAKMKKDLAHRERVVIGSWINS